MRSVHAWNSRGPGRFKLMRDLGRQSGTVWLVGAGPGDPELLTLKALCAIEIADVVVYDRLVSDAILDMVPTGVAKINVGKQLHLHPVPQDEINDLLVSLAADGRQVVRLKGGDPFMFGRGSEEAAYLLDHGISYEVIPGVTSATGCASSIGVPLTHRGLANGVRFVTGHCCAESELDLDWKGMADPATTLVLYMSKAHIPQIAVKLIANGLAPETPAAAICNGTRDDQDQVLSSLGEIAGAVADADFDGPVLFIIGRVVELAEVSAVAKPPRGPANRGRGAAMRSLAAAAALLALAGSAVAGDLSEQQRADLMNLVKQDCGSCHGLTMKGGLGPPLLPEALEGKDDDVLADSILHGFEGTPMPPWQPLLTRQEVAWIVKQLKEGLPE